MEPHKDNEEYLKKWEDLIDAVEKTDYPIGFVNRITFSTDKDSIYKFKKEIDIEFLRNEGHDDEAIKNILADTLLDFPDDEGIMEFVLDIATVAKTVQKETDKYLKNLQG